MFHIGSYKIAPIPQDTSPFFNIGIFSLYYTLPTFEVPYPLASSGPYHSIISRLTSIGISAKEQGKNPPPDTGWRFSRHSHTLGFDPQTPLCRL